MYMSLIYIYLPESSNTVCVVAVLAALTQICAFVLGRTDFEPSMYQVTPSRH